MAGREFIRRLVDGASENARDKAFDQAFIKRYPRCFSCGDKALLTQLVVLGMFDWKTVGLPQLANIIDRLEKPEADLEDTVQSTLKSCRGLLSYDSELPVWVLSGSSSVDHLRELGGLSAAYTPKSGGIRVAIYPVEGWLERLPFVIAHEYHHAVYSRFKPHFGRTLLGRIVAEGLADDFANRLFPGTGGPWTASDFCLRPIEEIGAYQFLLKRADEADPILHQEYLYGLRPFGGMTRYTGFAVAYRVVQGFITSHNISVLDLLELDPRVILEESTYHPQDEG